MTTVPEPTVLAAVCGPSLSVTSAEATAAVRAERSVTALGDGVWRIDLLVEAVGGAAETAALAALDARLADRPLRWSGFTSGWGGEYEPTGGDVEEAVVLRTSAGRSSHGVHPWLAVETAAGALVVTVAWSGNWAIRLEPDGRLVAGVDGTTATLSEGERLDAPAVLVALGPDVETASVALAEAVGRLVPRSAASEALPTEWNHWWPYEDADIDAETFVANARTAAELGLEVATLDAGWFGAPDAGSEWMHQRGDWAVENTVRFPGGVADVARRTREAGVDFGVWLEGEAVGRAARLRHERPELLARRSAPQPEHPDGTVSLDPDDPGFLGYVCLGSPAGRRFVAEALDRVATTTGARWLKLDFNVDPGAGCDRTDHGHGAGDGLLRHVLGLYEVLDGFRAAHPEVVLEACASGGLRIDAGLAQHVHCTFLSDPDWTEHHLQVLWGASRTLPPAAVLHWSWSTWRGDHADQRPDPATLSPEAFATTLRAAMLHRFGVSLRLPDLAPELRDVLAAEVRRYGAVLRPFVRDGVLRRLTGQPLRHGRGERVPAFRLDHDGRVLVAGFVLPGGATPASQRFGPLPADRRYRVELLTGDAAPVEASGAALTADGVAVPVGATSWFLLAEPIGADA